MVPVLFTGKGTFIPPGLLTGLNVGSLLQPFRARDRADRLGYVVLGEAQLPFLKVPSAAVVKCGGTLADGDAPGVDYYFCDGRTDACYASWIDKNIVVFHWRWVSNSAFAKFPMPIAPYVLNDCGYDFEDKVSLVSTYKTFKVEERSQTTADDGPSDEYLQSTSYDEGPSGITLVDEASLDKVVDIPFIDLTKVKAPSKRASSRLRIDHFCGDKRPAARQRQRSIVVLPFRSGRDRIPRLSFADARQAFRDLDITMSTIVKHNEKHLGKTLRCGYCTKTSK